MREAVLTEFSDAHKNRGAMIPHSYRGAWIAYDCVCKTFKTGNGWCPVHGHVATRCHIGG